MSSNNIHASWQLLNDATQQLQRLSIQSNSTPTITTSTPPAPSANFTTNNAITNTSSSVGGLTTSTTAVANQPLSALGTTTQSQSFWVPPTSSTDKTNNGHFYCLPKPLLRQLHLQQEQCCFTYIDGHEYTITNNHQNYFSDVHQTLLNVAAAPVFTLQSSFDHTTMPEDYMVPIFKECMALQSFWQNSSEFTIKGHYNSTVLKEIIQLLPKTLQSISMVHFTTDGNFNIDSILQNSNIRSVSQLYFNCRSTTESDFYANINAISLHKSFMTRLFLITTGFAPTARKWNFIYDKLRNTMEPQSSNATIMTSEKIDDQIFQWLKSKNFEYAGRTRYELPPGQFEHYETFNQTDGPFITIAVAARN